MTFQWYRWDPEKNRMTWTETETEQRPGPEWEASDVPLFDSDRHPRPTTVTVQEDPPLQAERHPATGLFRILPPEGLKYESPRCHPSSWPTAGPLRGELWHQNGEHDSLSLAPLQGEALRQRREMWLHPSPTEPRTWDGRIEVIPVTAMGFPPPRPDRSPRVRAWWQRVHRRSSATRVQRGLPRRSGLRLAGHRPLTSEQRR